MRFNYNTNYIPHTVCLTTIKLFSISSLFLHRSHNDSIWTFFYPSPSIEQKHVIMRERKTFFLKRVSTAVVKRWKRKEIKANYRRRCLLLTASLQLILFDTSMTPLLISHTVFGDDKVKVFFVGKLDFRGGTSRGWRLWEFYTHS